MQWANDDIFNAWITKWFDYEKILGRFIKLQNKINMYILCNKAQTPFYLKYFVLDRWYSFDLIKWVKTNPIPSFYNKYMSDTEYCLYIRKGWKCMPWSFEDRSTLYQAPINYKDKKIWKHPTIKPINILEKLIRNSSNEWDLILDCFMWSWSTWVACVNTNRDFIWIEIDKWYYDIAVKRIEESINNRLNWQWYN